MGKDGVTNMAEMRRAHAYILMGPADARRQDRATELAAALLCPMPDAPCRRCRHCEKVFAGIHPDVITVERLPGAKGKPRQEILVDQIRQATADAAVAPNEAARKVYIIAEADRMNTSAQNALLKALEDPPGHACFILCAAAADGLLPTVRSRCVRADGAQPGDEPRSQISEHALAFIDLAAAGDVPGLAMFCMLRNKLAADEADALLDEIQTALGDILCARRADPGLGRERIFKLTGLLERAREHLRCNVSPRQVFGLLAAETLR